MRRNFLLILLLLFLGGGFSVFGQNVNNYTVCTGSSLSDSYGTVRCGFWRTIQGSGTFVDSTNHASWTLNNLGLGTNIFWFYEYKNCGNRNAGFTHEHTINAYVYSSNAGRDTTICWNITNYQLNGNDPTPLAGVTGTWSVVSGSGTFANKNLYNTTVSGLTIGTINKFQWTYTGALISANCGASTSDIVNITVPTVPNAFAGNDTTICPTTSATLKAPGGNTAYLWSTGATTRTTSVSPAASANYKVTVTDANGCKASDDVNVYINTLNTYNISASSTSYCPGGTGVSVILSGSDVGVNYQLYKGGVADGAALAGTGGSLTWVNKTVGTYTIVAKNPTTTCTQNMNGSVVITTYTALGVYTLSASSATYCSNTSGVTLTLSGSDNGANFQYQLYKNGVALGTALAGTGGVLTWSNMITGNYSVSVTNTLTGCTANMTGTPSISSIAAPTVYNVGGTASFCELSGGSPVTLDGSQGGVNYQLIKNGLNSGGTVAGTGAALSWNGNLAGTYTVQATNAGNACTSTMNGSAVLTQISLPTVYNLTASAPGYCTGGVTLTLSSSQVGVNYDLYNGVSVVSTLSGTGSALTWNNMLSGTYTVKAKTGGTPVCSVTMSGSPVVTAYAVPVANAGADKTICQNGSVQLSASGGTTYSWSPSTGLSNTNIQNPVANPMATQLYTVTVTNASGCSSTDDVQVTVNVKPVANLSAGMSTICAGDSTQLSATGGNTYLWNTGSTSSAIWVKPSTTTPYWVVATNAYNCTDTARFNLNVNPKPSTNAGGDLTVCKGTTVTLTATGADTYVWSNGANTASVSVTPSVTSTYTVTGKITATGCQATDNVVVNVNPIPASTFTLNGGATTQFCVNSPIVTLAGNPNAGGTFGSSAAGAISGNYFDPSVSGVGNFTITYTYTDSKNCSSSTTTNISVVALPVVNISGLNASYCNNNGAVTISGSPLHNGSGVYGTWTFSGPAAALTDNGNGTATFNPSAITASGNYTITYRVANSSGCYNTATKTVLINLAPSVSFIGLPASACQNAAAITLIGNMSPSGQFAGSGITDLGNGTATFNSASLSPNTYPITYTYQDPITLCSTSTSKSIIVKQAPVSFSVTGGGSYCQGGAGLPIGLSNSEAGTSYELFLNGFTTSQVIAGTGTALGFGNKTSQGTYTIIATNNATSCAQTMNGSAGVIMNPLPADAQVMTGVTQVCPGTSQNFSVPPIANATTYNWVLPLNASITAGSGTNSVTIYFPPNAASGNITVTGQNACGSGLSSTHAVTVLPLPGAAGIITGKATVCQGETNVVYSIAAIGNATGYAWTVPSGVTLLSGQGTTQIIVNYTASSTSGNITVKGTNSCGSGAASSEAITVVQAPQLSKNAPSGMITCTGTPVTVSATSTTGGASFSWTAINGGHIVAGAGTPNPSVDASGGYIVTVTEPINSCTSVDTVTVYPDKQVPQNVNITATNLGVISCTTTQSTLTASTTSVFPVGYVWSASAGGNIVSGGNTASAVVDKGGVYQVTVTNLNNGCVSSKSITVTESKVYPDVTVVDPASSKLTCSKTTVTLSGSSSTSGVTYSWTGPGTITSANTATPGVNAAGLFTLVVIAPNGCSASKTVNVLTDYTLPTVSVNAPPTLTCTSPTLTLNGSSTTAGATLLWTGPGIVSGQTTQTPVVNQAGNYTLTVTHPITGCTASQTVEVTQDLTAPTINFPVVPTAITCSQTTSALTSSVTPAGSTLKWTGPGNISNAGISSPVVDAPGNYSLTATHPTTGCTSSRVLTVADGRTPANVSIAAPSTITCTLTSVTLTGSTTNPGYSALWSTSDGTISGSTTNLNAVATSAGTYKLTITNTASGCSASQNVTVSANTTAPDITVNKNPAPLTCVVTQVSLYGASVTPSASLLWSGPAGANITDPTTQTPKVDAIGTYTLTVTATNGCQSTGTVTVGQDKTLPAVPSIVSPQQLTCSQKTVQLQVSPVDVNCSYSWTTSGTGNIANPNNPTTAVDAIGTYTVKATNMTSGCSSQNSVVVSKDNTTSSAAITGGPYSISCTVPSAVLDGSTSTGVNPVWTATLGGHILSGGNTFKPTVDAAGTYTITTADATTGCTSSASISVTSDGSLPGLSVNAFPAKLNCGVTSVTLSGQPTNAGDTYTWTASPGHIASGAASYNPVVDQPGTYILTVTSASTGCKNTASIQVQQDTVTPSLSLATPAKITCTVTQVKLAAATTSTNVSYAWATGGTGTIKPGDANVSNPVVLSAGTYTVTLTNLDNQCSKTGSVTVLADTAKPNINVGKSPLPLTCTNKSTQLSGNSLTSGVSYLWGTTGTGNIINPTSQTPRVDAVGTYNLTVTNTSNGCTATDFTTVTQDIAAPNIWVDTNPAVLNCVNKTVNVTGNSSTSNVTYLWSGPGNISDPTLKQPTVDAPGTYTLKVTSSANGCTSFLPVVVTKNITTPAAPSATNGKACFNASASTLSATGTAIKWYSNATLQPANKLHDGNTFVPSSATTVGNYFYFVTQTDTVSQCESAATQVTYSVLTLPAIPTVTNQAVCQGTSNPALQATGSNIQWFDAPNGNLLGSGGLYTPPASVSAAGTYTYYATQTDANNCQSSATPVTLTINAIPAKPVMDKLSATVCQGSANPSFTASGNSIKWYTTAGGAPIASGATYTPTVSAVGVYPYYIAQTSAQGCNSPYETVNLTIAALPQVFSITGGGVYCEGQTGITIGLNGSQTNTDYQLILNGISVAATVTGNGSAFNYGAQQTQGIYTINAKTANGCQATMNGNVPVIETFLPLAAGTITGPVTVCQGVKSQLYTVPPVANATSYVWTVPPGATISSGQGTNTIKVDYGSSAVSGVVTVKGSNSCGQGSISSLPVTVVATPQLTLNTSPSPITCTTPVITLSASSSTSGATFSWTPINGGHIASGAATANPSIDAAGDYTVTVLEPANSCKTQGTVTVVTDQVPPQNVSISASNSGIVTCTNSPITLSATTTSVFPVSYSWAASSGGHITTGNTTANIAVDKAGVYTVVVTNLNNGCRTTSSITISEQKILPDIAVVDPASQKLTCTHTSVQLSGSSATPGATFSWTGAGTITGPTLTNPTVNDTGIYTLTVTAPNGCTASKTVHVLADKSVPTILVNTNPGVLTCATATVTLNGSSTTTGAQLLWTGPGILSGSDTDSPVVNKPGNYTLTVYHPTSGCTSTGQVTVSQDKTAPTVTFPVIPATLTCTSPQTTITGATSATSPTYKWTTGNGTIVSGNNTVSAVVSKAGTYMLSVTDNANGCSANASLVVYANQTAPDAQIAAPSTITCTTPSISLSGSSVATPINIVWTTADGVIASGSTSFTPSVTKGGTYVMLVTNTSTGCSNSASVLVPEDKVKPVLSIDKSPASLSCGKPKVSLNGTAAAASLQWTGPASATILNATTSTPTVDKPGRYYLTATAANGCVSQDSTDVTGNFQMPQNLVINAPGTLTCTTPTLQLTGSSSTANAIFYWSAISGGNIISSAISNSITINAPGTYKMVVTHPTSLCKDSATVAVLQDMSVPSINFPVIPAAITCTQATSTLISSVTPLNAALLWSGPGTISNINIPNPTVGASGTYTLVATHPVSGCKTTRTITVPEDKAFPGITISTPNVINCSSPSVTIHSTTTIGNFTALWTTSDGAISGAADQLDVVVSKAGLYTLTVTNNFNGCSTSKNINVTADNTAPAVTVDTNPAQLTCTVAKVELFGSSSTSGVVYSWIGPGNITGANTQKPQVDAAGDYVLTVTALNGCTSKDTVTVTEDKTTPTVPNILAPQVLTCNITSVNLEVSPVLPNVDYVWSTSGFGKITNGNTAIATVDAIGTYTVVVANRSSGCTNQNNVTVAENKSTSTAAVAGGPFAMSCAANSITLDGSTSTGMNPVWTASQGGHIVSGSNTFLLTVNAPGMYTLTVSDGVTGCPSSINVPVLSSLDLPTLTIDAYPPALTCTRSSDTLYGKPTQANTRFTWIASPGNIVSGINSFNPVVNQPGTYILTVTDTTTGCINTASIQVVQNATAPLLSIAPPARFTCSVTQVKLSASSTSSNVTYAWSTSGGGSIKPGDENVANPTVLAPGTYTVTLTDFVNKCFTVNSVTVLQDITSPSVNVNKTPAQLTCTTKQVILSGNSLTSGVTYQWTTSGTGNIVNSQTQNPRVDAVGYYKLTVLNTANGCTASDSVQVTSNVTVPNIWVNTLPDTINCAASSVKVSGSSSTSGVTYLWSGPGHISDATLKEPLVDAPGTYYLTVTSSVNGCNSSLPVTVVQNKTIPTAPLASPVSVCYGTPAGVLTATGNNVKWYSDATLAPAAYLHTGNTFTPSTATAVGTYSYFITQTNPASRCTGPASQVNYNVLALPSSPSNIDNAVCQGQPNPILQAYGSNVRWYSVPGGSLLASGIQYTPPASVSAPGTYTYYATQTDGFGCESQTQGVSLVIRALPSKPLVDKLSANVCQGLANPSFIASGNNINWYASATLPAPVKTGSSFTPLATTSGTYNYYVTQTDAYGCVSPYETVALNIKPLPQKFTVTGGGVYCENLTGLNVGLNGSETSVTYQLLLNGTTIVSSLAGTGAVLNFGLQKTPGNYTITAIGSNGCTVAMIGGVSIVSSPMPWAAGNITGQNNVCQGSTSVVYSVSAITYSNFYIWSVPSGATITSGVNSNTITVDFGTSAVSGSIHVIGANNCGSGSVSADLQVVVGQLPGAATAIKYAPVNNVICLGDTNVIYEVAPIANATDYEWVLPAGATIQWGFHTNQIKVKYAANSAIGAQSVKVRGVNSCGSGAWSPLYAITVNPNPSVYAGIDQNLCTTAATLQGSSVPAGGTGVWELISGSATITSPSQNNTSISSIAQGDNLLTWKITLNGCKSVDTVKISNNMVNVDAGQNLPICATNVTLKGSTPPTGTSGIWSVKTGSASFVNASLSGTNASSFGYGDNILYWTVTKNGCKSRDSVVITNYRPVPPDAGADQTICYGNTVVAAATPPYGTGQWSVYSGLATIANPASPTTSVTNIGKNKNVLLWTVTNQICSLSDTLVITNNAIDVNAGYDQVLCDNRTTMNASVPPTGAVGQWSVLYGSASFLDGKAYNTKVSGLVNGPNKLIWSIYKGTCINTDTVTLVCNMPTPPNAGPDQFIATNTTTLAANQPTVGQGKWSIVSGAASFADDTLFNSSVTGLNPGINTLRWTISYKGCSTFDDVDISNGTIEKVDAGQDQVLCTNETYLEAAKPTYGFGVWTVQRGSANFDDNEAYNTRITNLASGTNVLRWSVIISGVEFFDTVVIVNNTPTTAMVGPTQALCGDSSVLTGNFPVYGTGKWTLEGGSGVIDDITQSNSKVTKLNNGDNLFRWTITNGTCVSSALLKITNDKPSQAYAGLDQTICDDKTTLMPASPTIGTGEWSVVSGSGNFVNNDVSGLAVGSNTLRWTVRKNGCSSYDDVVIISHKPTTASAGFNTIVCVDSTFLTANKPNYGIGEFGRWTLLNGSGTIVDTTLNTSLVKRLAQGNNVLRWTIYNNGCTSSSDISVNYAFIKALAGSDVTTCDDHVLLNANNPGAGNGEWSVIGGSGSALFVSPSSPNTEVQNLDKGKNILRWTIRNFTCASSSDVTIINNSPSDAFAGVDQNICSRVCTLDARQVLIGTGSWSVLSGSGTFSDTAAYNSVVSQVGYGTNTYRWTVTNGNCTSTDEVRISNDKPINTDAGVDQTLCADSTYMRANQPMVGSGVWSITKGAGLFADSYYQYTKVTKLGNDTNILRWTVTNKQCIEYKEVKIVNNLPTKAIAGADVTICSDQVTLDGNIPRYGAGQWSVISGSAAFGNKNMFNTVASGLTRGDNVLRWKITKQTCFSYDDVKITDDLPSQPDAGTNIAVCDNNAPLNAAAPTIGKGYWTVVSGKGTFLDSSRYNTIIVGLGQGSNMLRWTTTHNRCSMFDMVEVKNNQTSVYAGPDQKVFEDHSILVGNQPERGVGTWSLDAGAGTIETPGNPVSYVSGLGIGKNTFIWSVNIDGCVSSDRIVVAYYKLPTAAFAASQTEGCPPLKVSFVKASVDDSIFVWNLGLPDSTSKDQNPVMVYTKAGLYQVKLTVTGPDGNDVSSIKQITVYDVPVPKFEIVPNTVFIPDQELRCFNYSQGASSYVWDFGDGVTSNDLNPVHLYKDSGYYSVSLKVISPYNCTDSLTIENGVHVMEQSRMKFPTAFTPNTNGPSNGSYNRLDFSNDVFYPIVMVGGLQEYKMEIFNRWGVLIFESNNLDIGWDGYYKGQLLMQDVYIYRVSGVYNDGKRFIITGDVLLMRR